MHRFFSNFALCTAAATLAWFSPAQPFVSTAAALTQQSGDSWSPLGEPGCGGQLTAIGVSPHDPQRVLLGGDMLGVGLSVDGGATWLPTFGFDTWEVASFTWHPTDSSTVWVGTMGGPYKSTDAGQNWFADRSGMDLIEDWDYSVPIELVAFDPNDDAHLLAFSGSSRRWDAGGGAAWGSVWERTTNNAAWTRLCTLTASGSSQSLNATGVVIIDATYAAGSSTRLYATGDGTGVYRSDDGGSSWVLSNTGLPHTDVEHLVADPIDPNRLFVALANDGTTPGGVYLSTDGAATWTSSSVGLAQVSGSTPGETSRFQAIKISEASPNVMYTGDYRYGSTQGVAKSTDSGATWQTVISTGAVTTFDPSGVEMHVIEIDPTDANRVFAAGSAYVLRSENGGTAWTDVTTKPVLGGFAGTGYTGWVSTNVAFDPLNSGHVIVQAFDAARVIQTFDAGQSWSNASTDPTPYDGGRDVAFAGAGRIYATFGQFDFQGIGRSLNNGLTWSTLSGAAFGLPSLGTGVVPSGIRADSADPLRVWAVVNDELRYSADGGDSWSALLPGEVVRWIEIDSNSTVYVSAVNRVLRATDGLSFQSIGGPGKPGRLSLDSSGVLYLAAHDGTGDPGLGVHKFDGQTWTQIFADPYAVDVAVHPTNPCVLAVTTDDLPFHDVSRATGVYTSSDCGSTWASFNDGLPMLRGGRIAFDPHNSNTLVLGTTGRGFFEAQLTDGDGFSHACSGDGGDQMGCTNCPCGNNSAPGTVGGCLNSALRSARLLPSGFASFQSDSLHFNLSGAPSGAFCILNSGDVLAPANMANPCFGMNSGAQAAVFDGLRCAVVNTSRHGGRAADANGDIGLTNNGWGPPNGPMAGFAAQSGWVAGQTRHFQVINRDDPMASCGRGLNTSQSVTVTYAP